MEESMNQVTDSPDQELSLLLTGNGELLKAFQKGEGVFARLMQTSPAALGGLRLKAGDLLGVQGRDDDRCDKDGIGRWAQILLLHLDDTKEVKLTEGCWGNGEKQHGTGPLLSWLDGHSHKCLGIQKTEYRE